MRREAHFAVDCVAGGKTFELPVPHLFSNLAKGCHYFPPFFSLWLREKRNSAALGFLSATERIFVG